LSAELFIGGKILADSKSINFWRNLKQGIKVAVATFVVASFLSANSQIFLRDFDIPAAALVILIVVVLMGIVFDMIGVAVTVADEAPFHAKAARRMGSAATALKLIRNNNKVANFCCDVVGDICGTLSGGLGAAIAASLYYGGGWLPSAIAAGIVAAVTVGGKAVSKTYSIKYASEIVYRISSLIYIFTMPFKRKLKIQKGKNNTKGKCK
jgi:hypothetical protein